MVLDVLKRVYVNNRIFLWNVIFVAITILSVVFAIKSYTTMFFLSMMFLIITTYSLNKSFLEMFGFMTLYVPLPYLTTFVLDRFIGEFSIFKYDSLMTAVLPYMFLSFIIMFITIKVLSIPFINKAADKIKESYDEVKKERDLK